MHKIIALVLILALGLLALPAAAEDHTRADIRALYAALVAPTGVSPYLQKPRVASPYDAGALTDDALQSALNYVNFLRRVAYIENDVKISDLYTMRAQYAAALLAINDELLHDAPIAPGMDPDFYETAHAGTMSSSIASINWMDDDVLLSAIEYFVRDDGAGNLEALGHRRWLLNPDMGETGFGLANAQSGITYAAMYAHDLTGTPADWRMIAWPSAGAFPAELMSGEIAWSVSLNPRYYDVEKSDVSATIREKDAGEAKLSYFMVNTEYYGGGPCVIFVPDLDALGIEAYQQNQVWTVEVAGLKTVDGEDAAICYEVDMIALQAVDPASVELDADALTLEPGAVHALSATVVPAWADDLSVAWSSSNEAVCAVDQLGRVTAIAPGTCEITATAVNGRAASCRILVNRQQ